MPESQEEGEQVWIRGSARLNPTIAALMRRGIDDQKASELRRDGYTLNSLKQLDEVALLSLGLSKQQIGAIRSGARPEIPFDNLARVLWANRYTCCVCRQAGLAIIVHHIEPWAKSHDHSEGNLAVLCLEHHARAHTRGDLEQNLSIVRLRDSKARWEDEVRHLDAQAILQASRIKGHHWWWFNHQRLFELASILRIDLRSLERFGNAFARGLIDKHGELSDPGQATPYRYAGGNGNVLYAFVREVLENVLAATAVFNISDDFDRGFLSRVVKPGDIVFVQGRHLFRQLTRTREGPGQALEVRRQTNGVRVTFTADRWEAVAASAWASWMQGVQRVASIVRVVDVTQSADRLHLACTGLAMGFALEGLSNRSYLFPTWQSGPARQDDECDWLDGFDDAEL